MKIGFIGAGRAGTSLGKYISVSETCGENIQVSGYYSLSEANAKWAGKFTNSCHFTDLKSVTTESDIIVISTPDGAVMDVWKLLNQYELRSKVICHLSGSLSSDVFFDCEKSGAFPVSVHPMFAFSDKESTYLKLHEACFTLEGHPVAVKVWEEIFDCLGNAHVVIDKNVKKLYHCGASLLSNHVLAVLQTGYETLQKCGFTYEQAVRFSKALVAGNVDNAVSKGCISALTGPIDRNDVETVKSHFNALRAGGADDRLYKACGAKLIDMAEKKNPERDYSEMKNVVKM